MTQDTGTTSTHSLNIRRMTLDDVSRVREIDLLSFTLPWPEKSYLFELTENPTTLALVAEVVIEAARPIVIGMAVVWIIVDEAHIATIAIHPGFRGHGYGKKLLAATLRQAIQLGATQATLDVREHNELAQRMYQEFGFKMVSKRLHYYKDNDEDAVI
ncbi:MAG TPA: ribosomal protein S18-alanine N-acetyltransferase, partial [Anaerolineales bacterium]